MEEEGRSVWKQQLKKMTSTWFWHINSVSQHPREKYLSKSWIWGSIGRLSADMLRFQHDAYRSPNVCEILPWSYEYEDRDSGFRDFYVMQ